MSSNVLLAGNGKLAERLAHFLAEREELTGILLPHDMPAAHPLRGFAPEVPVCDWPSDPSYFSTHSPDYLLSVRFPHRFGPEWLLLPSRLPLNLHLGYLPHNRGAAPWVWPLVDGSPAGVSLHVMNEGSDTGPYLYRRRLAVDPGDTETTLRKRVEELAEASFTEAWPRVHFLTPRPQPSGGSTHTAADYLNLVNVRSRPG